MTFNSGYLKQAGSFSGLIYSNQQIVIKHLHCTFTFIFSLGSMSQALCSEQTDSSGTGPFHGVPNTAAMTTMPKIVFIHDRVYLKCYYVGINWMLEKEVILEYRKPEFQTEEMT